MKQHTKKTLKEKAVLLRLKGETYSGIQHKLKCKISKGTLSYWCSTLQLNDRAEKKLCKLQKEHLQNARLSRIVKQKYARKKYFENLLAKNNTLRERINDPYIAKMLLAILYLGEGGKSATRAGPMLGNSDPDVIKLYLRLLSRCYTIMKNKFRCTVQCRADQNVKKLEKYWSTVTGIPLSQFYKARIDPRSKGKRTKKCDYKGVCRIDYFSKITLDDILAAIAVIKSWAVSSFW